ncbi:hypothetical protein F443_14452 [Phytophthora nicotianae P1569]|uniref:Uncharacterized protein n=1 Tax=Phytophthora nicotianae P1569 TaxID=1317065 RepID=V9ELD1_PHYNI|nr:hypothetical protein F443_14452 [Phytophthora nicotianae P1569]
MPETRAPSPPPSTTANWDVATSNAAAHGAVPSGRSSEDDSGGSDEGSRLVPSSSESCESEEYGDSGDESFTPDSEACERDVESLSTTSASSEFQEENDISNFLFDATYDLRSLRFI